MVLKKTHFRAISTYEFILTRYRRIRLKEPYSSPQEFKKKKRLFSTQFI